ncbi:MAG: S9 family peptidase [Acidimicrobiales bacterium]
MPRVTAAMVAAGRVVGEPRISPDGSVVAFVAAAGGDASLVAVPAKGGPELVLTTEPAPNAARGLGGGVLDWTPDGSALVYAAKDGGLWLQPAAGGAPRLVAPRHADGKAEAPAVSPDGTRVAYTVDQRHVAVAALEGGGPWPVRLSQSPDFAFDPCWSPDGQRVAWHEWDVPDMPWDGSRIVVADADGAGKPEIVAGGDRVSVGQPRFAPDGRLGYLSDEGGWLQLHVDGRPLSLDVPGEHGDPSWGQGARSWCWSPDGDTVAVRTNVDGFGELVVGDFALGRGVHGALSWVGDTIVALRSGARTPTQIVAYDVTTGERSTLARGPVAGWESLALPEPDVVRTPDGVVARLYSPGGARPPLLCWVHGGPTGQTTVAWNARFAYFLDRGWAILSPDHRGSSGHGRVYQQAMGGRWGDLDVADCAAAVQHVVDAGLVDPDRVVATGASAGGFTTLLLLARHPQLFVAGVAVSAVTDLLDLAERSHRFERHYTHTLVGPLPGAWDDHRERSPLSLADRIAAPLLLLHGAGDEVVPSAQAASLAARLQSLGRTVELHVYDGEGHGWGAPDVVVDELTRIERFLNRHVLRRFE